MMDELPILYHRERIKANRFYKKRRKLCSVFTPDGQPESLLATCCSFAGAASGDQDGAVFEAADTLRVLKKCAASLAPQAVLM